MFVLPLDGTSTDGGSRLPSAAQVVQVSGALEHACAVRRDGRVLCWGTRSGLRSVDQRLPNEVPGIVDAVAVAASSDHTCVLTQDGHVACWGLNAVGQLGTGAAGGRTSEPREVTGLDEVVQISAGASHTCALRRDGESTCWGFNEHGQLGDQTHTDRASPQRVLGLAPAMQIAAGDVHTCALTRNAEIWCWGGNDVGQVNGHPGRDVENPTAVKDIRSPEAVSAGGSSCAIESSQRVRCWGEITPHGQPQTPLGDGIVDIATGTGHACAVTERGRVYCWGGNYAGQLGNGAVENETLPATEVHLPRPAAHVGAGSGFSCAALVDGEVYCWGSNDSGMLGDGSEQDSSTPVRVALPRD